MKTPLTILSFWLAAGVLVSAQTFQAIYNFSSSQYPNGKLVLQNGVLFGTTGDGGVAGAGSIFKISTNGNSYGVLKSFTALNTTTFTNVDGAGPMDGLVIWSNTLFGTTYQGGSGTRGTVFGVGTNGTGFAVLNHFNGTNGKNPYVGLTLWSNVLYGVTVAGGISNKGAIFRVNPDGSGYTLIKSFLSSEGFLLMGGLATDGSTLYGTTLSGGASNRGTIYSVSVNGDDFAVRKTFSDGDGSQPRFGLVLSGNTLYGVTDGNGINSNSIVFRINTDGSDYRVIKRFSEPDPDNGTNWDGDYIGGGLALWNGVLYGTARWGGPNDTGTIFKLNPDGTGFSVLKSFSAPSNPGSGLYPNSGGMQPMGDLMVADGVIYGVTRSGGTYGYGTIFRLTIPPTPVLTTTNIAGSLVVCWSDDGYNRTLQNTSDLLAGNWNSVTEVNWTNSSVSPRQIGLQINLASAEAVMFFRLR